MQIGSLFARRSFRLLALVTLSTCLAVGCSDKSDGKPKIRKRDGIVSKIDLANRVVAMKTVDKQGNPMELPGTFRDDTVVTINGRTMELKDIKLGDKVTVHGYKEGEGLSQTLIATRVEVDRPQDQDWKTPGQPAGTTTPKPAPTTQPANG